MWVPSARRPLGSSTSGAARLPRPRPPRPIHVRLSSRRSRPISPSRPKSRASGLPSVAPANRSLSLRPNSPRVSVRWKSSRRPSAPACSIPTRFPLRASPPRRPRSTKASAAAALLPQRTHCARSSVPPRARSFLMLKVPPRCRPSARACLRSSCSDVRTSPPPPRVWMLPSRAKAPPSLTSIPP